LRNAVQYTAQNSVISVRGEVIADVLKVQVSDHGPGVAPDNLERIFQPFFRSNADTPIRGYGLGLAIARQAIERHGGRIYASLPEGGGLAITFELPQKSEMAAS
jgi:signal transduction histidine kinase